MRDHYDFAKMNGRRNPYYKQLRKQMTIRLGLPVMSYFKAMAAEMGVPYQTLINLYLWDCVQTKRKVKWAA